MRTCSGKLWTKTICACSARKKKSAKQPISLITSSRWIMRQETKSRKKETRAKTNQRSIGVEKGISSADSSACGSLSGHGGNYSRDSGGCMPQERGCGAISALAHKLCRSLRMPAAEKPFFFFNQFSDPNCGRLYKYDFVFPSDRNIRYGFLCEKTIY